MLRAVASGAIRDTESARRILAESKDALDLQLNKPSTAA
jgi:hypothetical protein